MASQNRLHAQTRTLMTAKLKRGSQTHGTTPRQRWALALALELMANFGLLQADWHFAFSTTTKRGVGQARITKTKGETHKVIYLSTTHVEHDSDAEVEDTIRHEIAHALDYERNGRMSGHGRQWQIIAIEVGAKPERVMRTSAKQNRGYAWALTFEGQIVQGYYRYPQAVARRLPDLGLVNRPDTRGRLKLVKVV